MDDVVSGDFDRDALQADVPRDLCADFDRPDKDEAVAARVTRFEKVGIGAFTEQALDVISFLVLLFWRERP